jgi:type IV secretory pathway VirB2 component (pilin)
MLKAKTRDVVAIVILTLGIAIGGVMGWRYAIGHVVDASTSLAAASARSSMDADLHESSVILAGRSINTRWSVDALQHIGISVATAEKATVALYGAIIGGVVGLLMAGLLSEPLANVLTAWPRYVKRARAARQSRRSGADGLR